MDRYPAEGNWYLVTQKALACVSPHSCPGCLGFAIGLWEHRGCHGPRSVLPCRRALLSLICCWQALSTSQSQPCIVSPDVALSKWIWCMLLTTRPSKAKGLPIILRWLLKFGFVLPCLHFYCPLTFHFPFPSVLCHVLPVSLFHLFMCLSSHFSHPLLSFFL